MTYTTIKLRRGSAAQWAATNPTLSLGEYGYETDTRKRKVGDGTTAWNALPYVYGTPSAVGNDVVVAADKPAARNAIDAIGKGELVLNFADYGVCDGVTNDSAALATVLSELSSAGGGTLMLPPVDIAVRVNGFPTFTIPGNTTIVGTPGATRVLIATDGAVSTDHCFVGSSGDNVTISGVEFIRQADFKLVFFFPGPYKGFHIRDCVVDGRQGNFPTYYVHGIDLDANGTKSNITAKGSTFKRLWFGLFQSNAVTSTCDTIVVDDCDFESNFKDDLEFNAPNSVMKNVSVTSCRFRNNIASSTGAGFGVGIAHVIGASVIDCNFENFPYEPIHIEDYSTDIKVIGNRLSNCGTTAGGGILVITGSSDVVISGNTIDATANTNAYFGISILAAASGTTPGGRAAIAPSDIVVSDNIIRCGAKYAGIYVENVPSVTVHGNQISGSGVVTAGVWDDANARSGLICDGVNTVISGNTISGFRFGMSGPYPVRNTLGNPGVVTNNMISNCYGGIWAASPGALTITDNMMSNCVRPMIVGEATVTAKPSSVVGNFATGCVHPLEIGGKLILLRDPPGYPVSVGTGRSIYVIDKLLKIPVGTVINFSGGGTFTVTTAATTASKGQFSYELVGDVTGGTIGATAVGTASGMAFSTTGANNYVAIANNADTAAGSYNVITGTDLSSTTNSFPTFDSDQLSTGLQTMPRWTLSGTSCSTLTGYLYLTYATAHKTMSVSSMRMMCGTTAAGATPTLLRLGIYRVDPVSGDLTLVGSTDSDTSLFASPSAVVSKDLAAAVTLTGGTRYAFGFIVVTSATAPSVYGATVPAAIAEYSPRRTGVLIASNLPGSIPNANLSSSGQLMYIAAV